MTATLDITDLLKDRSETPANVVAWVHDSAYSAGAIISLARLVKGLDALGVRVESPLELAVEPLEEHGMRISGQSPDGNLVEMIELPDHPYFIATQFHPELKSRPNRPHPLFASFVEAAGQRAGLGEAEPKALDATVRVRRRAPGCRRIRSGRWPGPPRSLPEYPARR